MPSGIQVFASIRNPDAPTHPAARPRTAIRLLFGEAYGAAKAQLGLSARHEQSLRKNNRAKNSHLPVRRRERKMQRFKSSGSAQRFLSVHAVVQNTFNVQRHLVSRNTLRVLRGEALQNWQAATAA